MRQCWNWNTEYTAVSVEPCLAVAMGREVATKFAKSVTNLGRFSGLTALDCSILHFI